MTLRNGSRRHGGFRYAAKSPGFATVAPAAIFAPLRHSIYLEFLPAAWLGDGSGRNLTPAVIFENGGKTAERLKALREQP